jgi:hypothetical protein
METWKGPTILQFWPWHRPWVGSGPQAFNVHIATLRHVLGQPLDLLRRGPVADLAVGRNNIKLSFSTFETWRFLDINLPDWMIIDVPWGSCLFLARSQPNLQTSLKGWSPVVSVVAVGEVSQRSQRWAQKADFVWPWSSFLCYYRLAPRLGRDPKWGKPHDLGVPQMVGL